MAEKKPQPIIENDGCDQVATKMESLNVNIASGSNIPGSSVKIKRSKVTFLSIREKGVLAVLQYLAPVDLINVAQTNRFLKRCADSTISNCYELFINPMRINSPNDEFFRQFGHLARELIVHCSKIKESDWNDKRLHILPVIADRCQKKLKSLRLEYVCENLLTLNKEDEEKVRKLFIGVNKLYIMDSCLIGWDKLMKNARIKLDMLSLEFYKTDLFEEYIRNYHGLKSLHMSQMFSTQLFDLNPTIKTLNYHSDSVSKNRLKNLSHLPQLKNLSIIIMGPSRNCNIISSDFSTLANISTLQYLYLMTTMFYPMKATAYISTLMALQHHEKLAELHFFCQFVGAIPADPIKFKENAFPNLKQFSMYGGLPFIHAVSQFKNLVDIFIMESSTYFIQDYEPYRDIITKMPKLQRLVFDITMNLNDGARDSLVQMCQSRTSQSNLVILIQNFENNIIQANMYPKTILMFSVHQPTVSKKRIFFDPIVSVFDRARLIAEKGEYVAINYIDFTKGINSVENNEKYN